MKKPTLVIVSAALLLSTPALGGEITGNGKVAQGASHASAFQQDHVASVMGG